MTSIDTIKTSFYVHYIQFTTIFLLCTSTLIILLTPFFPKTIDQLALEDGLIENLSALFLFASVFVLTILAIKLVKFKKLWSVGLSLLLATVFFIIGMEEISWGQRILQFESSSFFLEHNMQEETNLHNLHTPLAEQIYYCFGFLLLLCFPFFNAHLKTSLHRLRWHVLLPFLPPDWMFLPFAVMVGFVGDGIADYRSSTIIFTIAFMFVIHRTFTYLKSKNWRLSFLCVYVLGIMVGAIALSALLNYPAHDIRSWMLKEYMELFIALGIMSYAISIFHAFNKSTFTSIAR